jgi:hypothetical protein
LYNIFCGANFGVLLKMLDYNNNKEKSLVSNVLVAYF